jgi:hypothetical protein
MLSRRTTGIYSFGATRGQPSYEQRRISRSADSVSEISIHFGSGDDTSVMLRP